MIFFDEFFFYAYSLNNFNSVLNFSLFEMSIRYEFIESTSRIALQLIYINNQFYLSNIFYRW